MDVFEEILEELKKINEKLDVLINGSQFFDENTERVYKEYEKRELANFIAKTGLPPRLPNECPKCYEKGKIVKGNIMETTEFKNSLVIKYKCPVCGYEWVSQVKKGKV